MYRLEGGIWVLVQVPIAYFNCKLKDLITQAPGGKWKLLIWGYGVLLLDTKHQLPKLSALVFVNGSYPLLIR